MRPEYLVIHCSASDRSLTSVRNIRDWHLARGWKDIGYHKIIDITGKVHQGRPDTEVGAHAAGFNSRSLGICLIGDFDKDVLDERDPQFKALVQVCATLCRRYGIPAGRIIGHRDVYKLLGQKVAKTCPGRTAYELMGRLRELVAEYLG